MRIPKRRVFSSHYHRQKIPIPSGGEVEVTKGCCARDEPRETDQTRILDACQSLSASFYPRCRLPSHPTHRAFDGKKTVSCPSLFEPRVIAWDVFFLLTSPEDQAYAVKDS